MERTISREISCVRTMYGKGGYVIMSLLKYLDNEDDNYLVHEETEEADDEGI